MKRKTGTAAGLSEGRVALGCRAKIREFQCCAWRRFFGTNITGSRADDPLGTYRRLAPPEFDRFASHWG